VKTPTPTISATTMAVATVTETVDPPPESWPGHAALPVPDAAMPVYALRVTSVIFPSCRLSSANSSNANNDLNQDFNWYQITSKWPNIRRHCEKKVTGPQSGHDFVFVLAFREWGVFPEA
jgi:hypothetical protein